MRLQAIVLTTLLAWPGLAAAQTFTGAYTTTTPAGTFTLTLAQDAQGQVTGTLVGPQLNVQVQGALESAAAATGVLTSAQGQSFFRADLAGGQMTLTVVDPNAYGQPDYSTAQQFLLTRGDAASGPPAGSARPQAAAPPPAAPPAAAAPPTTASAGRLGDPQWGFTFEAPRGWVHRQTPEAFLLGSNTEKGAILVFPHTDNNLQALRSSAQQGIQEQGTQLTLNGGVQAFGDNGLAAQYKGIADGQQAKGYAVGLISPHGGGATILTLVESASYSAAYSQRVEAMARSVRFSKVAARPVHSGWQQKLAGHCVAYLSTYSSSGGSYGGYSTGGYSSTKSRFYLYPDGRFEGGSSSSISIDTGGAFGSGHGNSGPQAGRWQVVGAGGGGAVLQLNHPDGSTSRYQLSTNEKGHTLLDGERWFVVSYQECNDL